MNIKDIKPLGNQVVVKVEDKKPETVDTKNGFVISKGVASNNKNVKEGVVVSVGKGLMEDGKRQPLEVKVGDKIIFNWSEEFSMENVTYNIMAESNIFAVIPKNK